MLETVLLISGLNLLLTSLLVYLQFNSGDEDVSSYQLKQNAQNRIMKAFAKPPIKKKPKANDDLEAWKLENNFERNTNG